MSAKRLLMVVSLSMVQTLPVAFADTFALPLPMTHLIVGDSYGNNDIRDNGPISGSDNWTIDVNASSHAWAAVDASGGLHATGSSYFGYYCSFPGCDLSGAASSGASAIIDNPFVIVPGPDFVGTSATIQIPFDIRGIISDAWGESLNNCPGDQCSHRATASIQLWYGSYGQYGGNPAANFFWTTSLVGSYDVKGSLSGPLGTSLIQAPVNTLLYLVTQLSAQTGVNYYDTPGVGSAVDFSNTLSYTAFSTDDVSINWGLTPQLDSSEAPEPAPIFLLIGGLALVKISRLAALRTKGDA
jgi:hypothetical protein